MPHIGRKGTAHTAGGQPPPQQSTAGEQVNLILFPELAAFNRGRREGTQMEYLSLVVDILMLVVSVIGLTMNIVWHSSKRKSSRKNKK